LVEQLSFRKRFAASRNISCSSEKPKSNLIASVAEILKASQARSRNARR
jgi:hypothetical protein